MKTSLSIKALQYGFILSFIFCLLACTKDVSKQEEKEKPLADPIPQFAVSSAKFQSTAKFLKREISYTKTAPFLKNIRLFTYDNSGRCTEVQLGSIDSASSNPVFTLKQKISFNYNGTSLLPASLSSVRTALPNLTTIFYYQYNSQGRKIMDSVRVKNQAGTPADRVIHYVYGTDKVSVTPMLTGFPMENNSLDTLSLLAGGNIEKLVSRVIRSAGDQFISYTFTYDESVNPYNRMNIANSLYFESASLGLGYNVPQETHYMGVTSNNMTSWTSGTYTVNFRYVYAQDRYPLKKEMFLPGETTPSQTTLFEY
ncbi:MAG TPA: hypothetical protein VMR70_06700 [Flavisolibacter sp.]|nr:hypothetical protein [Flavisolibacter sp.]